MKTAVIIPVHNESNRIAAVIREVQEVAPWALIIVVDDGSTDATVTCARSELKSGFVLHHTINLGKGAALKTGCLAALREHAECIVLMDGDGQHKAEDIPKSITPIETGKVDVVFGCRHIGRDMPLVMMLGNKFLTLATSFLFGIYVADTQSGFRAFRASVYPQLKWNAAGYSVETEMIVNTAKAKLRWGVVDISTIYHDSHKGTTIIDGFRIFLNMLIWKLL